MFIKSDKTKVTRRQGGFSLIELLVVVAIIGVLAGAGIVGYSKYLDSVKLEVHKNNAAALAKALSVAGLARSSGLSVQPEVCQTAAFADCVAAIVSEVRFKSPFNAQDTGYIALAPDTLWPEYACQNGEPSVYDKKILIMWPPMPSDPSEEIREGYVLACFSGETGDAAATKSIGKDWANFR